jgi:predicted esterase
MSPMGSYTVRLPSTYDKTKPYPVVIGTHGCGDTADNFATWGPAAYNDDASERENDKQNYIALSVEDTPMDCWDVADDGKVLAALDDAAACFYVDQSRVTMAGYSSGAEVAYAVGLGNAQRFNGILIEDGACSDNPNEKALLAGAAWKINIAHITHQDDGDYPLASVQSDWKVILAAGYPLDTTVVGGTHDGTSTDWYSWLEPHITAWTAP